MTADNLCRLCDVRVFALVDGESRAVCALVTVDGLSDFTRIRMTRKEARTLAGRIFRASGAVVLRVPFVRIIIAA